MRSGSTQWKKKDGPTVSPTKITCNVLLEIVPQVRYENSFGLQKDAQEWSTWLQIAF